MATIDGFGRLAGCAGTVRRPSPAEMASSTISKYETGGLDPTLSSLRTLARSLRASSAGSRPPRGFAADPPQGRVADAPPRLARSRARRGRRRSLPRAHRAADLFAPSPETRAARSAKSASTTSPSGGSTGPAEHRSSTQSSTTARTTRAGSSTRRAISRWPRRRRGRVDAAAPPSSPCFCSRSPASARSRVPSHVVSDDVARDLLRLVAHEAGLDARPPGRRWDLGRLGARRQREQMSIRPSPAPTRVAPSPARTARSTSGRWSSSSTARARRAPSAVGRAAPAAAPSSPRRRAPASCSPRRDACLALVEHVRAVVAAPVTCEADDWGAPPTTARARDRGVHDVMVVCAPGARNLFSPRGR